MKLPFARRGFHYNNYTYYLHDRFGGRVQRVAIEGGFTCPNRDGSKGTGGCIYCNSESFSPPYSDSKYPIERQLEEGIKFLSGRFGAEKFIAYFQNRSNTYAPLKKLESMYRAALEHPQVVGLSVSTRPDCVDDKVLSLLADINKDYDVNLELGLESLKDESLVWMNRCHTMDDSREALALAEKYGLDVTAHLILGLPSETQEQMFEQINEINVLPVKFLKLHHLQVVENTRLAEVYAAKPFKLFDYREYIKFIADYISRLNPGLILQRVLSSSPDECLIAPKWPQTTTAFIMDLQKHMRERELWQGDKYKE